MAMSRDAQIRADDQRVHFNHDGPLPGIEPAEG